MTLTYGSLFSGIGGFDLSFDRAGFHCAWQVEIDNHAQTVLARHWPDVPRHADVRDVGAHNLAPVDVITFGSPCQDLSVAGKRVGLDGARSGLFHEAIRIIRELRPAIAIWENVPGALSSNGGRDFGSVIDLLADSGALDIGWRVLDAQWFGVAQRRRRVFVVADFGGRRAAEILALSDSLRGHPAPRRQAGQGASAAAIKGAAIGREPHNGPQRGEWLTDDTMYTLNTAEVHADSVNLAAYQSSQAGGPTAGLGPLAASDDNGSNHVVASAITASAGHHGHSSPRGDGSDNQIVAEPLAFTSKDSGGDVVPTSPTLRAMNYDQSHLNGGGQVAIAFNLFSGGKRSDRPEGGFYVEDDADLARTLHTSASAIQTNQGGTAVRTAATVRRLTPRECARLQAFPDDWIPASMADSHHYRLLGNAVCVNVAEWIGRRVMEALS